MNKQLEMLGRLSTLLKELSQECLEDGDFNDLLAGLNVLTRSADEIAADVDEEIARRRKVD